MLTVKMLKPYYIKADSKYVQVILAYQYFSVLINDNVYHFIPREAKEIKIDRQTKKIVNVGAKFAFQKGKDIIHIAMTDLISLPDFLIQLHFIVESYYAKGLLENSIEKKTNVKMDTIIKELEQLNVKRLIDKSLDERDREAFAELVKLL